ncbi:unknown [Firmicutes bacterium CAG:552]|nr:unknown [Firmicutes bacterium CAG:552]
MDKAGCQEYVLCDKYSCKTDFVSFRKISAFGGIKDVLYENCVKFSLFVPSGESIANFVDKTCGRLEAQKIGEEYIII